jgi:hypothetical protein
VAACLLAIGCGGGGDDSSTAAESGSQFPGVTAPDQTRTGRFNPEGQAATGTGTATAPSAQNPAAGLLRRLGPFRDCLTRHGVQPPPLNAPLQPQQGQDPAQIQKEIQVRIACIPELPPRLRKAAERLKKRYEQRQQQG